MQTIEIVFGAGEFSHQLQQMRLWLDERHCEPSRFDYVCGDHDVVIHLHFKADDDAEAFAKKFAGQPYQCDR
jgi:hypothetical protein